MFIVRGKVQYYSEWSPWMVSTVSCILFIFWHTVTPVTAEDFSEAPVLNEELSEIDVEEEFVEVMIFDLYIGDKNVGSVLTNYTESWYEISSPKDAAKQYKSHVIDPDALIPLFEGKSERDKTLNGVGSLTFEPETFRIIIKPEDDMLSSKSISLKDQIPDPEQSFSFRQRVRVAGSGNIEDDLRSSLTHRSLASYGKNWFDLNGTVIQEEEYELNTLSLNSIISGAEVNSGFLQTQGTLFTSTADITGVSIRTSEDVILDQEQLRGSKLEIFVPARARVDFFRGGRLLSTQELDFGLQEVDTRSFPNGNYEVEVVITTDTGEVIREKRFFTKSGLLSVRSIPIWSLTYGVLRDELELFEEDVVEGSIQWRALNALQLSAYGLYTDQFTIYSLGATTLWQAFTLDTQASRSDLGDWGYRTSMIGDFNPFTFSISVSESFGNNEVPFTEVDDSEERPDFVDPIPELDLDTPEDIFDNINGLARGTANYTASASLQLGDVRIRYGANRFENEGQETRFTYGPDVEWRVFQDKENLLTFRTAYLSTQEEDRVEGRLEYRYFFDTRNSISTQLATRTSSRRGDHTVRTTVSVDGKDRARKGTRLAATNSLRSMTGDTSDESVLNTLGVDSENDYIRIQGDLRDQRLSQNDFTTVSGAIETSFHVADGSVTVDRPVNREGVFIAEVASGTSDSPVDLIVNGQVVDSVIPGKHVAIGLTPFQTYSIGIRPGKETELIAFDTSEKTYTIFPGNIVKRTWDVEKIFIALGVLEDLEGNALEWKRIRGISEYVVTEDGGFFQAEITGQELLYIHDASITCVIALPKIGQGEYFTEYGTVVCRAPNEAEAETIKNMEQ